MRLLTITALTLLAASGAHAQGSPSLIGEWTVVSVMVDGEAHVFADAGVTMTWSFAPDGTAEVAMQSADESGTRTGTFTVEGDTLEMTIEAAPRTMHFVAREQELVVTLDDQVLTLQRVATARRAEP